MEDKELLEKGYYQFEPSSLDNENIIACFQKCIKDEFGKKYFIDIKKWQGFKHPTTHELFDPSYEFEVYFTDKETDCPVKILLYAGWSVDDVEDRAEKLWQTDLWKYYERYEEE